MHSTNENKNKLNPIYILIDFLQTCRSKNTIFFFISIELMDKIENYIVLYAIFILHFANKFFINIKQEHVIF